MYIVTNVFSVREVAMVTKTSNMDDCMKLTLVPFLNIYYIHVAEYCAWLGLAYKYSAGNSLNFQFSTAWYSSISC